MSLDGSFQAFERDQKERFGQLLREQIRTRGIQFVGEEARHGEDTIGRVAQVLVFSVPHDTFGCPVLCGYRGFDFALGAKGGIPKLHPLKAFWGDSPRTFGASADYERTEKLRRSGCPF